MTGDLTVDLAAARAALIAVTSRTVTLFGSLSEPSMPVRGVDWSVGEVGAHLVGVLTGYTAAVDGDNSLIRPSIPTGVSFAERLSATTAALLNLEPEREPAVLARLIEERVRGFLDATSGLDGTARIPTPWYGDGVSLSVATTTAMLFGEQLIHGYDVALTTGVPWPIAPAEANLMFGALTAMIPLAVNPAMAAGVHATYQLSVRQGGPRMQVRVDDARVVVRPVGSGRVDCHISGDPVPLLLVVYGRLNQWGQIARGRLLAWGRKPWLGFGFTDLFYNP